MKNRVPDSTGLPLRAMVMVLLFLGVVFLLLGWQALSSSGHSDDESASPLHNATTTTSAPRTTATTGRPPVNQTEVRIYNISEKTGIAARTKDQLTAAGFRVTEVGNLSLPHVTATTVYYTDAEGERATADAVGQKLAARVEPRIPALAKQPPGVIVVVAG